MLQRCPQALFDEIAAHAQPFLDTKAQFFSKVRASQVKGGGEGEAAAGGGNFRYGELDMSVYEKMAESTVASFRDNQMISELQRLVQVLSGPELEFEQQQVAKLGTCNLQSI